MEKDTEKNIPFSVAHTTLYFIWNVLNLCKWYGSFHMGNVRNHRHIALMSNINEIAFAYNAQFFSFWINIMVRDKKFMKSVNLWNEKKIHFASHSDQIYLSFSSGYQLISCHATHVVGFLEQQTSFVTNFKVQSIRNEISQNSYLWICSFILMMRLHLLRVTISADTFLNEREKRLWIPMRDDQNNKLLRLRHTNQHSKWLLQVVNEEEE